MFLKSGKIKYVIYRFHFNENQNYNFFLGLTILLSLFINVHSLINTLAIVPCKYEEMKKYTELCASNGKTYKNICDFRHDKLLFDPNLVLLTLTSCPESIKAYTNYKSKPYVPKPGDNLHFDLVNQLLHSNDMNQNIKETLGILQDYSKQ